MPPGWAPRSAPVRRSAASTTPSGALVAHLGDVVVKVHHPRTDPAALAARLAAVTGLAAHDLFVQPLAATTTVEPADGPARHRLAAGRGARSGRTTSCRGLRPGPCSLACTALRCPVERAPASHGGGERLARAVRRVESLPIGDDDRAPPRRHSAPVSSRSWARPRPARASAPERWCTATGTSGSWLASTAGWRLLDVDDVGPGDPAWDLGRPAGFWAAGLLGDEDWHAFLDGYRASGGPGVPPDGDPWPRLDLPARCAVFVATVRELGVQPTHSENSASDLLQACARM